MADYLTTDQYQRRAGGQMLPRRDPTTAEVAGGAADDAQVVDTERIDDAINDASGVCQTYLKGQVIKNGVEIPLADLSPELRNALPGLVFALARAALADADTGDEDESVTVEAKRAIATLKRLAGDPLPGGDTPGSRINRAAVFDGGGRWLPGLRQEPI